MRSINSQLAADVAAGFVAFVLQVTRADGVVLYFTDHDAPITIATDVYASAPGLSGVKLTLTNNATVGDAQTRAAWMPVLQESDILAGLYDNATVSYGIASWKNPSYGILWLFSGLVALLQLAGKDGECYCAERLSRLLEMDAREQGRPSVRPLQGVCRQADCRGGCHLLSGL